MEITGSEGWAPRAIAICVPVRNEQMLLPQLLAALAEQSWTPPRASLCLLLDGCTDASEAVALAWAARLPFTLVTRTVPAGRCPNAGLARRRALALGVRAVGADDDSALLSTDADTVPAPDWIAATCEALRVADVVTGRILRGEAPGHRQDRIEAYFDALYALRRRLDPVPWEPQPAHHHTGGASLAFRTSAYRALGGFPALRWGEDAAMIDAAHRHGLRVRRDCRVRVETSARREGRVPNGLADHLRRLDGGGTPEPLVSHPADAAWQYRRHAAARASFASLVDGEVARLAAYLGTDADHVRRVAAAAPTAEAFATHVVPAVPTGERLVPLEQAERALARLAGGAIEWAA